MRFGLPKEPDKQGHLVSCDYFVVDKVNLTNCGNVFKSVVESDSFQNILFLSGKGTISQGEKLAYVKGDSFFLEAGSGDYEIKGEGECLITSIPRGNNEKWA